MNGYRADNFQPYVYVSEDYGTTWKQIGMDLPYEPVNVIKEDTKKEQLLYVGTDNGLYASFDLGTTFMSMNHNLPWVPIHDLAIQVRENDLVVGTHGRSIYITKLDSVQKIFDNETERKLRGVSVLEKVRDERTKHSVLPLAQSPRRKNELNSSGE